MICSRGNLSMVAGADVGFEEPSVGFLSIAEGGRGCAANLSRKDGSREVEVCTSSAHAAGALSGELSCEVCCE